MKTLIPWRLRCLSYRLLAARQIDARSRHGMITFSFDDFPRTALTVGGEILARHALQGTYYVAGGLAGVRQEVGEMFSWDDLDACARAGHEIGGHTFSHMSLADQPRLAITRDVQKNGALLERFGARNFSFPFGRADLAACGFMARYFDSCRGTQGGINLGDTDLNYLKAVAVYGQPAESFLDLIAEARRQRGWLIFYTHDIADSPSRFGCRIALFERLVAAARSSGCMVGPVRDCLAALQGRAAARLLPAGELLGDAPEPASGSGS